MKKLTTTLAALTLATAAHGGPLRYQASLDEAKWEATATERACALEHAIPGFGAATFRRDMGRPFLLEIQALRAHLGSGQATLHSNPPQWRAGIPARELGRIAIGRGLVPFRVEGPLIHTTFAELESGMTPTLRYADPPGGNESVVALTPINFNDGYRQFLACANSLIPPYEKVKHNVIHFDNDSSRLTDEARDYLDLVIEHLNADNRVRYVRIDGHSDMRGTTKYNDKMSLTRAANVQLYLTKHGIDEKKTKIRAFGRRRPVAENKTEEGRAKNRRVEIELVR